LDKPVKPQDKGVKEEIYGIVEFKPSFRPEARNHIEATRGYFECEIE
jgi:hypothetical protein